MFSLRKKWFCIFPRNVGKQKSFLCTVWTNLWMEIILNLTVWNAIEKCLNELYAKFHEKSLQFHFMKLTFSCLPFFQCEQHKNDFGITKSKAVLHDVPHNSIVIDWQESLISLMNWASPFCSQGGCPFSVWSGSLTPETLFWCKWIQWQSHHVNFFGFALTRKQV